MSNIHSDQPDYPVYNVPMALDQTFTRTRGLEPVRAEGRNKRMVADTMKSMLGPMPVCEFLDAFIAEPGKTGRSACSASRGAFRFVPQSASTPAGIRGPLLLALNHSTKKKSRTPGFTFHDTSARVLFPRKLAYMKPDICCYASHNLDNVITSDPASRSEFGYAELFFDVKADPSHDYFVDPPEKEAGQSHHDLFAQPTGSKTQDHRRSRAYGQHVAYVTEIFARQQRVFVFTVSMSGSCARLLRWDRAGCIVSRSFDIREEPQLLCEFLWRFSQTDAEGRGHDPGVKMASLEEETLFADVLREYVQEQTELEGVELDRAVSEHYHPGHVTVVCVLAQNAQSADGLRSFLVSRPVISPLYLLGRGTRGWWAVDMLTRRVVFLKDTWRIHLQSEGDIALNLLEKGVRNVPSVVCHGDVPDFIPNPARQLALEDYQCSVSDQYRNDPWVCEVRGTQVAPLRHLHYRIVFGTVGYGLKRLRGTEELLHVTHDVFHAMQDAFSLASRLHRDISVGNVIMVREKDRRIRRGYLIDWDASCEVGQDGMSVEAGRAGTWLFTSERMLMPEGMTLQHTLQDDMESLLYVVLYCSFLWLPHNLFEVELKTTIRDLFEHMQIFGSIVEGGEGKAVNAMWRRYTKSVAFNPALKEWLDTVMDYHSPRDAMPSNPPGANKWARPDDLEEFWTTFLQTHADLPRDDRVVNPHPHATDQWEYSPGTKVYAADFTTEAISMRKRSASIALGSILREESPRKKTRYLPPRTRARTRTAAALAPRSTSALEPLRRSVRIRDKQNSEVQEPMRGRSKRSARSARQGARRRR